MSLVSRTIFIDTQYLLNISFNFNRDELKSMASLVASGFVKVYITDITEKEIEKNIVEMVRKAFEKINHSDARILKSVPDFWIFFKNYDADKIMALVKKNYEDFKRDCKVTILHTNDISIVEVYSMYAEQKPPFDSAAKKNEFPDAFALKAIEKWVQKNNSKAYLLSGDKDWIEYSKQSYSWPYKEVLWLPHLPDLSTFIDLVYRTEAKLQDLSKFGDQLIENYKQEIEARVFKEILMPERVVKKPHTVAVEIDPVNVKLTGKEIIRIDRDYATFKLDFEVEAFINYEFTDYDNSVYDSEVAIFVLLEKNIFYAHQNVPIRLEYTFSYTEGLESNFRIEKIEGPSAIELSYSDDDIVNVMEWIRKQPVVIDGVDNGQITSDGSGRQEFSNFDEAKMVFPTLVLGQKSKDFILSDEYNWYGPIYYMTMAVADNVYGKKV